MIIKLNREVKKLTKEQVEVLKTLGACIEVRDKRYFIEARVDNDTSLLDIAPIWNWEFAGNMRDYYICEGESKYTPTLKEELEKEGYTVIPIYAYIHSGCILKLGKVNDPWDSGLAGIACMKNPTEEDMDILYSYIEMWNRINNETIYSITVKDEFGDTEEVTDGLFKEGVENIASYYKVSPEDIYYI